MDKVIEALAAFQDMQGFKDAYIDENINEDGDWDRDTAEGIADYNEDLAYLGGKLAEAVAEMMGAN